MKIRIAGYIAAGLVMAVVLGGASVWEGAAAVAPNGDLPAAGYYAATNSFPRNTVVDITNLESGKSIRVIVAAGLDTPGLLALVSRDAAAMIGMEGRSIGRIRMTQPSDPIAFSRFTERLAANGMPDYDSGVVITEESLRTPPPAPPPIAAPKPAAVSRPEKSPVPAAASPSPASTASGGASSSPAGNSPTGSSPTGSSPDSAGTSAYVLEPEWEEYGRREIVDLPDTYSPLPAETGDDAPPVLAETAPPESPEYFIPEEPADIVEYLDIGEPAGIGRLEPEEPPSAAARQTPEAGNSPRYAYTLVPAEERPPEAPDPYAIDPEDIISGIAAGEIPSPPPAVPQSAPASPFSVPLISDLERGGYYVQIAAHSRPELIESAISRIEGGYPLAVQSAGSADKPVYRILLGPLNLGESGAVLQRLKSIGYTDAFVRKN